jgi:endonuclease YncB( thermonuclease family)
MDSRPKQNYRRCQKRAPSVRFYPLAAFFIVAAGLIGNPVSATPAAIPSVIDGDTLEIHGERIRLFGIDAPESKQQCAVNGKHYRCGQVAANALDGLIARRSVTCTEKDQDRYGRSVAICYVGKMNINEWMVREGHAVAYTKYSNDYVLAEQDARVARRGIWSGQFERPQNWRQQKRTGEIPNPNAIPVDRCSIKGNINSRRGRIYHLPGQRDYSKTRVNKNNGERWFCSEEEAMQAGWIKAKR